MKILKVNSIIGNEMLRYYKKSLLSYIDKYKDTKSLRELSKSFTMSEIYSAVDSIIIEDGYIYFVDGCRNGMILRLLQYGGPNIKALNLLTLASLNIRR